MALYPNRKPGNCTACKARVAVRAGFIARSKSGGWDVFCNSDRCIPAELQKKNAQRDRKELTAEGELYFPYDPNALDLLRAFPPTRDRNKKVWDKAKKCRNVSLAMEDRPRVLELCDRLGIKVADELKKIVNDPAVDRALERCRQVPSLYPFQPIGVEFLARRHRAILADDMGLGKTVQALLAADEGQGLLVVCPQSCKYNWAEEVEKWRPDLTAEVMQGRGSFRWPKAGEVVITNFEILPRWLMPVVIATRKDGKEIKGAQIPDLPSFRGFDPKNVTLVVDEAQRVKNYRTQTHKKIKELAALCGKTWFLTGTPIEGKPTDLYGVLQAGHMDRDVFGGWRGFVRCFQGSRTGFKGAYEWGSPLPEVPERMRRVMLRRLKEEVLPDLPSFIWRDVAVDVRSKRLLKSLNAVWDRIESFITDGVLPAFEDMSEVRAALAKARIPAMLDLVTDFEDAGEPLVVFSAYKAPIEELAKREGWAVIHGDIPAKERQEAIRKFQAGELRGIGLTIASGGVGINLTRASNILFVDLDWKPTQNAQAADRVRRIGQKARSVQVIRLVSNHPVDRRVQQILARKMQVITKAIEDSISYEDDGAKNSVDVRHESQVQYDARMKAIQAAAQQAAQKEAKERVVQGAWMQGERAKAVGRPEVDITPTVAVSLRDALKFMLNRCDGAQARDNVGFSKPDAGRARILAQTGLTTESELRATERMLSRYFRQLYTKYPELFADAQIKGK